MTTIPLDIVEPPITNDNDGYWIDKELILEAYESGDISELCANDRAVYKAVVPLINSIKKTYSTDFEREKAVHDWLVLNASYDYDKYLAGALDAWDYHPYGVLVMKTGVCQSYAEAFDLCMAMLGIESEIVTGYGNGGPHAWNAVKLDGEWYQIDVTWDDPVPDVPGKVIYSYFNVTDVVMKIDHEYTYHNACNGTKYNNEYIIKTYYNLFENIDDYYTHMINEFAGGAISASAYVKVDPDVAQDDLLKAIEDYTDFIRMKVWETKYASEGYSLQYSASSATRDIVFLTIQYVK
jgi:transglutaminase/protease-like cytokinesis protein 3